MIMFQKYSYYETMNKLSICTLYGIEFHFIFIDPPGCSCEGYEFLGVSGCRISPNDPPSPGYKCLCRNYLLDCAGEEVKCGSASDIGCNGCSDRQCCSEDAYNGDCNGYVNK